MHRRMWRQMRGVVAEASGAACCIYDLTHTIIVSSALLCMYMCSNTVLAKLQECVQLLAEWEEAAECRGMKHDILHRNSLPTRQLWPVVWPPTSPIFPPHLPTPPPCPPFSTHSPLTGASSNWSYHWENPPPHTAPDSIHRLLQATPCADHCQWRGSMYAAHACCKWTPIIVCSNL